MSVRSRWLRVQDREPPPGFEDPAFPEYPTWGAVWRSLFGRPRKWRKWRAVRRFPVRRAR